jgi:hypothetical protein
MTWIVALSVWFGVTVGLAPSLWDPRRALILALPLYMTAGFSIKVYGPVQDWLVARDQRRARG